MTRFLFFLIVFIFYIVAQVKKTAAEALQSPPGLHVNQNALPTVNKTKKNDYDDVCLTPGIFSHL